jgi:2-polyprenyl-3-methyl-5-hydroxy-6-metoxy-1,4-benzoquinol methylase
MAEYREYGWNETSGTCASPYIVPGVLARLPADGRGTRLLDVGCGNGYLAGRLLQRGYDVTGIDLSHEGVDIARRQYTGGRFEVQSVEQDLLERLDADPFDVIVSTEVIEHLYSPKSFARACHGALRPRGTIIVTTPDHNWIKNVLIAVSGKFDNHVNPNFEGGHIKFFSRKSLGKLLADAGFVELEFGGVGRLPFIAKSLVATARRPGGLSKRAP